MKNHKNNYPDLVLWKGSLMLVVMFSMFISTALSQGSIHRTDGLVPFDSLMQTINLLEESNNYEKARTLAMEKWKEYPEYWFDLAKEIVYLNSKTGRYKENLLIFREGHAMGYFFFLHPGLKSSQPYKEFEQFDQIAADDQKLRDQANKNASLKYRVCLPEVYSIEDNYPLMIILHGGGSSMEKALKKWQPYEWNDNCIIVFMQSSFHLSSNTYGWSKYDPRSRKEIKEAYWEIIRDYPVDTTDIILSGISAGATMALDLYVNNIIPLSGLLAFSPAVPREFMNIGDHEKELKDRLAVIIYGELESEARMKDLEEIGQAFHKLSLPCQVFKIAGLGHNYPDDFPYWIRRGIQQINSNTIN